MTIQVTGTLVGPISQPLANAVIRVTALDSTSVVALTDAKIDVGITGSYDFTLQEGKFSIEVLQSDTYHKVAYVDIPSGGLPASTLEALINTYGYCELEAPTCPV